MAKSVRPKGKGSASKKSGTTGGAGRSITPVKTGKLVKGSFNKPDATLATHRESAAPAPVVSVLTTTGKRPEFRMSGFEKMELIEEGISKKALENLKEKAKLDYDQLARLLNVARATLINKKGREKFNADISDKIVGLADIYSYGYEVFEDREKFNNWVFQPNKGLGGQAPFNLLHNSFGREEVKHLIGRIEYGIYS